MGKNQLQNIKALLQNVSTISKKYNEIAKITGENYNIFNILNLSTNEVKTHSAFISDLLNINSSHGQGNIFLKLFYEQLKNRDDQEKNSLKLSKDDIEKIPSLNAEVFVEEYIGKIDEDEGGRIDIVIKDNSKQIVIENKINAKDQYKQLVRYNNQYPNALLLYLTLTKQDPIEKSITRENGEKLEENKGYFNITYNKDILNWLIKCKEKATSYPILRETLTQYINLIKQLTGQTMNKKMRDEMINEILKNEENISSFFNIQKQDIVNGVKKELINNLKEQLIKEFKEREYQYEFSKHWGINNDTEVKIYIPGLMEEKTLISFYSTLGYFKKFIYGVRCDNEREKYKDLLEGEMRIRGKGMKWDWVNEFENPFKKWDSELPWLAIKNGILVENIIEKAEKFLKIFSEYVKKRKH